MATFITSKSVGQGITIVVNTSTGFFKYNHDGVDSPSLAVGWNTLTVTNPNGEFTIIPCLSDGTVSGVVTTLILTPNGQPNEITSFDGTGLTGLTILILDGSPLTSFNGTDLTSLTQLWLQNTLLTSFDGTGLSSLTDLYLTNTPLQTFIGGDMNLITSLNFNNWGIATLTSFDGTGLSSLTNLSLGGNQLTSFDGTGLSGLTYLDLQGNQLTSFDGAGLSSLTNLSLGGNQLTSFDGTGLISLTNLFLGDNQLTSFDGTGLSSLTSLYLNGNQLTSFDGTDLSGLTELSLNDNQITSFDGTDLSGLNTLNLNNNQLTSFDGTGLQNLDYLYLTNNQITSLSGFILPTNLIGLILDSNQLTSVSNLPTSLIELHLQGNQLTSFDGTDLTSLTYLNLTNNQLTSFDGTGLSSLIELHLQGNQLTSFDGTDLTSLTYLNLNGNNLTSLSGFVFPTSLTNLTLESNQLTSFGSSGLTSLTYLGLYKNFLTSFDGTGLTSLTTLNLIDNQLTSLDVSPMVSLQTLYLVNSYGIGGNPMTVASNNSILDQLNANGVENGGFYTINGRTSDGTADYDALIAKGWNLIGLDLVEETTTTTTASPVTGNGKLRIKGVNSGGGTTTTTTSGPTFAFFNRNSSGGISNTLIEVYKINENDRTVIMIDSGLTDTNGYFYSYVAVGGKFEYAFKCYDTTDNLGNLTWGGIAMVGNTHARPLTRNVYYNITVYSTFDSNPVQNLPINLTEYFGSGALNDILDISPNNRGLIGTTDENGNITGNIMADFQLHFGSDEFTDGNGVLYRSEELVFIPQNQNSYDGGANLQPKYATWNLLGVPGTNNLNVLDQIDNDGNFIANILIATSEGFATFMLIDGVNYKLSVYDGTDNPPTTEPIYTETWTAVWGVDHVTDLSTTTTTTTTISYPQFNSSSSDYITGTNTRTEFGMMGMTNLVSDVSFNSSNILSYIDSNTDATLEIQMTNINDQELVISGNWELSIQNGDVLGMASLFMSNIIPITHDDIELRLVNTTTGEILESRSLVNGTITGGVLPTTTTTTTTIPSLYWDSIELGSVDEDGNPLLNIDFTEYGFDYLTSFSRRTVMVIPVTGNVPSNQRVGIDGVPHAIVPVYYFDNTNDDLEGTIDINVPSQDPTIGTINKPRLSSFISAGNVMTTDQVKLAVIQAGFAKGSTNTYITDSLSSTIGTVQDILDIVPAPSYMFSIPEPAPNSTTLARFSSFNITTTTGYFKYEQNGIISELHTGYGNGPRYIMNLGYGDFTFISCDGDGNPSGTITQMNLNGLNIDSFNGTHSGLSGLTRLTMVTNSITSLDVSSMTNLDTLFIAGPYGGDSEDSMTPQSNTDILLQLNANGLQNGTFTTNGGRVTSQASEAAYLGLINKGWTLLGLTAV